MEYKLLSRDIYNDNNNNNTKPRRNCGIYSPVVPNIQWNIHYKHISQRQPLPAVNVFLFADIRISTYRSIIATFKFHSLSFHLFRWLLWSWFSIHVEFKFNTGHSRWGEVHQGRKLYWIRMIFVVKINKKEFRDAAKVFTGWQAMQWKCICSLPNFFLHMGINVADHPIHFDIK